MKRRLVWFIGVATIGSLSLWAQGQQRSQQAADSSRAGNSPQGASRTAPATEKAGRQDNSAVIPEFLFDGGTVRQLVERLKAEGHHAGLPPLNVIVGNDIPEAGQDVPRFELHNVGYADVFHALNKLNAGSKGPEWQLSGPEEGAEQIWVLNSPPKQPEFFPQPPQIDPLTGQPIGPGGPPKTCQIYQLQRYLGKYKVEDITTAIQTTW